MNSSRRILAVVIVPLALAFYWFLYGTGDFTQRADAEQVSEEKQVREHLDQAAGSIIAAAKESVKSAPSDEEATRKMQLSIEALRVIGRLGDFDTAAQTNKLLDDLQSVAGPSFQATIIQVRLGSQMQNWNDLNESERKTTINHFVADVKKAGLNQELARVFMQVVDMLERSGQYDLASHAVNELLPTFRQSADTQVARRAPLLEGVVRRLPGNKLELEGTLLDGGEFDLDSLRGKVVLVDFFASWCGPCRAEVPNILANYDAYKEKGFTVVGVNMDENRAAAESYVEQAGFDFPTLFSEEADTTGWDHPMGRKYGVTALPRVILVDQEGVIVSTKARGPNLERMLRELLGPPSAAGNQSTSANETDSEVAPASFEEAAPVAVPEE